MSSKGPKGLRTRRRVSYKGKKGEFYGLVTKILSEDLVQVKRYDTGEEVTVKAGDLKFLPKNVVIKPSKELPTKKLVMKKAVTLPKPKTPRKKTIAIKPKTPRKKKDDSDSTESDVKTKKSVKEPNPKTPRKQKSVSEPKPTPRKKKDASESTESEPKPKGTSKKISKPMNLRFQPDFRIIQPRFVILSTLFEHPGPPDLFTIRRVLSNANQEFLQDDEIKLAFVAYNADSYEDLEKSINNRVDPDNKYQALKTAIHELAYPPGGTGGTYFPQLEAQLIVLDLGKFWPSPFIQILELAKTLGMVRYPRMRGYNPLNMTSFFTLEPEWEDVDIDPHESRNAHNAIILQYGE